MSDYQITTITIDEHNVSCFSLLDIPKEIRGGMLLSQRIEAKNFRLRESQPGYSSDWHVAGDPTFISILDGTLRITLRSGEYKDFGEGDSFIAADYLAPELLFNPAIHGHSAAVVGDHLLKAIHIKLPEHYRAT